LTVLAGAFRAWATSVLLGVALLLVYLSNGRNIPAGDTVPSVLLTVTLLRGDGFVLDRFSDYLRVTEEGQPTGAYYVSLKRGHIVSRYPVGTALLAVPLVAPQLWLVDRYHPGWEQDISAARHHLNAIDKNSAALIATLAAVSLFGLLRMLGFWTIAVLSTVIAALGSGMWTVASQSLWQHGPAALALTLSLALLLPMRPSRVRLALAGLATAALPAVRVMDVLIAAVLVGWVTWNHRRRSLWFAVPFLAVVVSVTGYNLWYFGRWSGGQAELESLHAQFHAVREAWNPHVLAGAAGTLFSPSRGLFVFNPWMAVTVAVLPKVVSRLRPLPLLSTVSTVLVPYGLTLSAYSVWWGGHSFGPRFWTDAVPIFAILLAFGLAWSWERCRLAFAAFVVTGVIAIGIQTMGAFCYPSSWNQHPINVDQAHWRVWDWRDSELSRSFDECVRPRFPFSR
jgi:hypothetical protein